MQSSARYLDRLQQLQYSCQQAVGYGCCHAPPLSHAVVPCSWWQLLSCWLLLLVQGADYSGIDDLSLGVQQVWAMSTSPKAGSVAAVAASQLQHRQGLHTSEQACSLQQQPSSGSCVFNWPSECVSTGHKGVCALPACHDGLLQCSSSLMTTLMTSWTRPPARAHPCTCQSGRAREWPQLCCSSSMEADPAQASSKFGQLGRPAFPAGQQAGQSPSLRTQASVQQSSSHSHGPAHCTYSSSQPCRLTSLPVHVCPAPAGTVACTTPPAW